MQIQITAAPDPVLIAAATRHGLRRPILLARMAGWLIIALAFVVQLVTGELNVPLLALGAVTAVLGPLALRILWLNTAQLSGPMTTYEISSGGLASSSAESRHSYAWQAFRYVEELPGQLLFRQGRARFLPVPTRGLSQAEVERVLGFAEAGGLPVRRRLFSS
ncbi:YcxB family protein [Actinoplanes sp. NPDC051861]|uniref:YcxB family protein n=1 Tax=Actinoplanes sp. NPDC051861 TaxID=3155170 RepID=UPI003426EA68